MDDSQRTIQMQSAAIRKLLSSHNLTDALKMLATSLEELRPACAPKQYYELYLSVSTDLDLVAAYITAEHVGGRLHLAKLYETVQYVAPIVPRLYLLVLVASVCLNANMLQKDNKMHAAAKETSSEGIAHDVDNDDTAKKEVNVGLGKEKVTTSMQNLYIDEITSAVKQQSAASNLYSKTKIPEVQVILLDILEMSRGIQHAIRGLFLRFYISSATRAYLPNTIRSITQGSHPKKTDVGDINISIHFLLTNFGEMNKLWVRMNYQYPKKDDVRRVAERMELRVLVGTCLVRISQLSLTANLYKSVSVILYRLCYLGSSKRLWNVVMRLHKNI